jgi:hypothetical protein
MSYDYRNRGDLRRLHSRLLLDTDNDMRRRIVTDATAVGLMYTNGLVGFLCRLLSKLCTPAHAELYIRRIISAVTPHGVDVAFADTLAHMLDGKDEGDRRSAGGWGHEELNRFVAICRRAGWTEPSGEGREAA